MATLYDHIRQVPVVKRETLVTLGAIDAAFAGAARVIEAEYEWPFQSHASMGPACAVVDARADGATLWTGSQKPHFARDGVARVLGLPQDKVHGIWVPGPGSYDLPIVHLMFGNLKNWLRGCHHGVSPQHLQAYLNEFAFRFNRRFYPFNSFRSLLGISGRAVGPTYEGLYSGSWQHPRCSGSDEKVAA
jgi:hypothetical protein